MTRRRGTAATEEIGGEAQVHRSAPAHPPSTIAVAMRQLRLLLLLAAPLLPAPAALHAQAAGGEVRAFRGIPLVVSVPVPLRRPAYSGGDFAAQSLAGALGGIAAMAVVGTPLLLMSGGRTIPEAVLVPVIGGAYLGGTVAGVHYSGRRRGMSASPWATAGGALVGLTLAGAAMQPFIDDEGEVSGPAPLLVWVLPAVGGTTGFALTRRAR
jgi:hypothetical protein